MSDSDKTCACYGLRIAPHKSQAVKLIVILRCCRWVDGELLHLSGDGATTRGAELGFVWSGNQHHFLVVLKKIDLSET